jgi:hypothetical protein
MIKKHFVLFGIIASLLLFTISASYYPGGSQKDKNSIGYDWKNNYLCNLFNEKAMNGFDSHSRPWAIAGMLLLCISGAVFFIKFSTKIQSNTSANIIKYAGIGSMLFAFFVFTRYHDLMTTVSSTLALISLFYITVFIFKSKLIVFKILSIACLLILYCNNYIYYSGNLIQLLPIMQKLSFLIIVCWMLGLDYFTTKKDFQQIKTPKTIKGETVTSN